LTVVAQEKKEDLVNRLGGIIFGLPIGQKGIFKDQSGKYAVSVRSYYLWGEGIRIEIVDNAGRGKTFIEGCVAEFGDIQITSYNEARALPKEEK